MKRLPVIVMICSYLFLPSLPICSMHKEDNNIIRKIKTGRPQSITTEQNKTFRHKVDREDKVNVSSSAKDSLNYTETFSQITAIRHAFYFQVTS